MAARVSFASDLLKKIPTCFIRTCALSWYAAFYAKRYSFLHLSRRCVIHDTCTTCHRRLRCSPKSASRQALPVSFSSLIPRYLTGRFLSLMSSIG